MTSPEPDSEGTRIQSIDTLMEKVDKVLAMVSGGGKAAGKGEPDPEEGVSSVVQRELARLKAAEDEKAAREARDKEFTEVKARVEKIPERRPREYRRATNMMKWATEDDK